LQNIWASLICIYFLFQVRLLGFPVD
jgi:hypothetical protein